MTARHQEHPNDPKFDSTDNKTKGDMGVTADVHDEYDDLRLSMSSDFELDRKDLLIVKDGTVRVAESLDREQQQLDANGEVVKASGTWTKAEHERFLHAMETYPKGPWKAIAEIVATRTVRQTQTHAQKYREKMARRMRGLRNRNGTLQTPPMSVGMGIMGYPGGTVSHYSNVHQRIYHHSPHPGALGYTSMPTPVAVVMTNHMVTAPLTTMGTNTGLSSTTSVSAHHSPQQQRLQYISDAMSSSNVVPSAAFSQLSTSTISNAFIGNSAYPSSWEANAAEGKATVPDFDESMDFLMKMYSTNPNQINSTPAPSTLVTPTACIPRTPRTPLSQQRLTLEEKIWWDRRRNDIEQYTGIGGAIGTAAMAAVTTLGPFPRHIQATIVVGGLLVGGGTGYLYADSKALNRIKDLSASSSLRKQYQQIEVEKKASKATK
ncbi:hypothetical protein BBO99_00003905 [Phytophthora kernoviae]|uniref:Uncharacterized protein n=2 Tax=Phytophthora kernoviae TaxID=325452 RepID=A0A3R7GY97_9STRA|nr:hypothetical protein G195_010329 [Phytophthora kernoviae 00238/432]KAG2511613.1 hypothetical protein JM18_008677 [Phytophthora kernoviae]KAG2521518.1 hypothetical protein JM16_003544 [Phytophthora kernoviae]RLN15019.1 hypothetical protein BBI17_003929 [Phytophthora kernoviae]RLN81196.1 hypothetical protein BBO99_00003905 [Phytophthora kernoviae]